MEPEMFFREKANTCLRVANTNPNSCGFMLGNLFYFLVLFTQEGVAGVVLTLVLLFAGVVLAREERLVVLRRQVHVVVGERLLVRGVREALVLRATEQVHRVPPNFTFCDKTRLNCSDTTPRTTQSTPAAATLNCGKSAEWVFKNRIAGEIAPDCIDHDT